MNNYILNKLDVKSHSMEVLYISDDYKSAINYMHEYVEANYDKEHNCVYVKDNNRIFQYKKNLGYIYNNKEISHVFQICFYKD